MNFIFNLEGKTFTTRKYINIFFFLFYAIALFQSFYSPVQNLEIPNSYLSFRIFECHV